MALNVEKFWKTKQTAKDFLYVLCVVLNFTKILTWNYVTAGKK